MSLSSAAVLETLERTPPSGRVHPRAGSAATSLRDAARVLRRAAAHVEP